MRTRPLRTKNKLVCSSRTKFSDCRRISNTRKCMSHVLSMLHAYHSYAKNTLRAIVIEILFPVSHCELDQVNPGLRIPIKSNNDGPIFFSLFKRKKIGFLSIRTCTRAYVYDRAATQRCRARMIASSIFSARDLDFHSLHRWDR